MNITVYLASSDGNMPYLAKAAAELGSWLAGRGDTLIYGGSKSGLMGVLAESAVKSGGRVIGIEPQVFVDAGYLYDELSELIVTRDMTERKTKMIEMGDAFIAFPGGTGTLEEVSEVMSLVSLRWLDAPCILYDLNGYYEGLRILLERMKEEGLSSEEKLEGIYFASSISEIKEIIASFEEKKK